jgi:hypothetical protein
LNPVVTDAVSVLPLVEVALHHLGVVEVIIPLAGMKDMRETMTDMTGTMTVATETMSVVIETMTVATRTENALVTVREALMKGTVMSRKTENVATMRENAVKTIARMARTVKTGKVYCFQSIS